MKIIRLIVVIVISILVSIYYDDSRVVSTEYNKYYVKTLKNKSIYVYKSNMYIYIGEVKSNTILEVENAFNNYLKISEEYYIRNNDVIKIDYEEDIRYKKYIVFNENIETSKKTYLYDKYGNLELIINKKLSLPIYIKEDNYYGVEFLDRLFYVKKNEVEVIEHNNTSKKNVNGIGALNYHFFNDSCNNQLCISSSRFQEQLDIIKNNNILTLRMKEVEMYVDAKIQLPKSVIITIDDGWDTKIGVDILTKNKMYGTIFLVTSWYDISLYYKTEYIELHSHSDNMHTQGECSSGQGGAIQCASSERIQSDLKKSRDKLNNTTYFCYPFYEYNDYSISELKKAGFTMSFAGESGYSDNLIKVGSDKFKLPRFVVVDYTTNNDLINYFSKMN